MELFIHVVKKLYINSMKLVENKVWEYTQEPGIDGVYKAIRDAAAICYQTDVEKMKMAPKEFVENVLLKNGHTRPLEFGTVYLYRYWHYATHLSSESAVDIDFIAKYQNNKYSKVVIRKNTGVVGGTLYTNVGVYVTTNMRVIMQGGYPEDKDAHAHNYDQNWLNDLEYWCEPTEHHQHRRTFTMWMSRGCTDDNRTHISLSSICESTRFCNYSKDKFGNELTWIKPYWISDEAIELYYSHNAINSQHPLIKEIMFLDNMQHQENEYMEASKLGLQPQQLKRLFPLGVKAELRLCGFDDAWENLFWRRCDDHADPECKIISDKIKNELW